MKELSTTVKSGLAFAGSRWQSFWFQPQEMYTLGLVRIGFSALVIVWTLWLLPVRTSMLGPDGVTPKQPSIPDTWGLFAVWNSDGAILIGIAVLFVAAIALLVGSMTGGYAGGLLIRVLPAAVVRAAIILFGTMATIFYGWKYWIA